MRKRCLFAFVIVIMVVLLTSCSVTHRISNQESKAYSKEALAIENVEKVVVSFTRPSVSIGVFVNENFNEQSETTLLELTKVYVTVGNMEKIAQKVKWNLEIISVLLEIKSAKSRERITVYEAEYFKAYNATDRSEKNIDGYKTWRQW